MALPSGGGDENAGEVVRDWLYGPGGLKINSTRRGK